MRVCIVHDWLTGMRGGERVLEAALRIWPRADVRTLLHVRGSVSPAIEQRVLETSFIARLPLARQVYRLYLPLLPLAVERLDLRGFDLVLSVSHCVAKGAIADPGAVHVCYCLTPMRYAWDLQHDYAPRERTGPLLRAFATALGHYLRMWDATSASRVDRFVAISELVRPRIAKYYGRSAGVVPPPVDVAALARDPAAPPRSMAERRAAPYLAVTSLAPNKNAGVLVDAFRRSARRLVLVGPGSERDLARLRARGGANLSVLGFVPDERLRSLYREARALVHAGMEDFGLAPVEAMAAGTPVIALGRGGARETVIPLGAGAEGAPPTGVLFAEAKVNDLLHALERFEAAEEVFDPDALHRHAARYDEAAFRAGLAREVEQAMDDGVGDYRRDAVDAETRGEKQRKQGEASRKK